MVDSWEMSRPGCVDVILCGYRNDLARARVIDWVKHQPARPAGPAALSSETVTPVRLFAELDTEAAATFAAQLRDLGAQVRVEAAPTRMPSSGSRGRGAGAGMRWLAAATAVAAITAWLAPDLSGRRPAPARPPVAPQAGPAALAPDPSAGVAGADDAGAGPGPAVDAGTFRTQVEEIEGDLEGNPEHPVLLRNLQTALHNWGVAELNANNLAAAVEHLGAAAELGERAEVLQALGIARLRQGQTAEAAELLERALELVPGSRGTLLALADVYTQQDRRAEALELLQRARDNGPTEPELERRVQQLGREVDAEWDFVAVHDPHFRISFGDGGDQSAVRVMLDALDEAYYSVGAKFDYYPDGRTPVVLYAQQDFHAITQTPDWASGAYDGRIKFPVRGLTADNPQLARIARHEYAHSVIRRLAGTSCPVWLNEGLAVWAEEDSEGERVAWAEERISNRELFELRDLTGSFIALPAERIDVAYAQSYLTVRALIDRYGAARLRQLLAAMGRTGEFATAFADVYREDFAAFASAHIEDLTR
ncbi:tetratricopeptide repeat protein [Candidatus Binatia bacterium]|nr:tetratricopeptide repeat protein [Candidatus Binatia bacterium]